MERKVPAYGGQAVIEGVVMRGPRYVALSVRSPSGNIISSVKRVPTPGQNGGLPKLPVIRGALAFWDTLSLGMEMLMKSAEIASPEEDMPSKAALNLSVILAALIAVGAFVLLPTFAAAWLLRVAGISGRAVTGFVELLVRLLLLAGYIFSVSRMEEIQRVLSYHGAEHKVIWAWEEQYRAMNLDAGSWEHDKAAGILALAAAEKPRLHPRCGTSFLFLAVLCSWAVFLFVSPGGVLYRMVARILLLPVVAGLSYEILKMSAGRRGWLWKVLRAPGMALQILTTRDPEMDQLEVAAESLACLIEAERGDEKSL